MKISVFKHWRHFWSLPPKSPRCVAGRKSLQASGIFWGWISNTIFGVSAFKLLSNFHTEALLYHSKKNNKIRWYASSKTVLKQQIFHQKGPSYKQSTIQLFETFNIYLFETINVTGRRISKLVFRLSFRMKSGVEVKQQMIEQHSIFMYFPCSLRVLLTRKSVQLSCYSACDITDTFDIYWGISTFFNHNPSFANRMSLLFSSAMLLNKMT